ncbi:MAG: hypothetical protein V4631_20525 [Pseudomonadota bacterium]
MSRHATNADAANLDARSNLADASVRLQLYFAKDRKRTMAAIKKRAAANPGNQFGEAVSRVLMLAGSIPDRPVR